MWATWEQVRTSRLDLRTFALFEAVYMGAGTCSNFLPSSVTTLSISSLRSMSVSMELSLLNLHAETLAGLGTDFDVEFDLAGASGVSDSVSTRIMLVLCTLED